MTQLPRGLVITRPPAKRGRGASEGEQLRNGRRRQVTGRITQNTRYTVHGPATPAPSPAWTPPCRSNQPLPPMPRAGRYRAKTGGTDAESVTLLVHPPRPPPPPPGPHLCHSQLLLSISRLHTSLLCHHLHVRTRLVSPGARSFETPDPNCTRPIFLRYTPSLASLVLFLFCYRSCPPTGLIIHRRLRLPLGR